MNSILFSVFILSFLTSHINAQQIYTADSCDDSAGFLYTCIAQNQSCQAFLIFLSQPPYNSVDTISSLTSSVPEELARINNVSRQAVFPTNKEVIVPVKCSCEGQSYYWSKTTYKILNNETYFFVANNIYQGLSTCNALKHVNPYSEYHLHPGLELQVALRCACPTRNGTRYLLTYLVDWDDHVPDIAGRFNVSVRSIVDANGFLEENPDIVSSTTILIPLLTEPSSSQTITRHQEPAFNPKKSKGKLYVGLATGCFLLVIGIILSALCLFYKKRLGGSRRGDGKGKTEKESSEDLRVEIANCEQVLEVFQFEEIKKATENFSTNNRLRSSVYRGEFGGKTLAVKKVSRDASKEVNMLQKIKHFNLIKLEGVCEKYGCLYLLFEYMENGSLREWLRGNTSKDRESWTKRIQIAVDVANGLHYLHNFTEPPYIHMDINSSNILLNSELRAKIGNFRLARTVERESGNAVTVHVEGTRGYMAPEYKRAGLVTPKMDVYAFGVIMLELITGKGAIIEHDEREVELSAAIVSIIEGKNPKAKLSLFVDPTLKENEGAEFALQMAELSVACLTQEPARRPRMWEVVSTLLQIQADFDGTEAFHVDFITSQNS
jgi:hypothetical protein